MYFPQLLSSLIMIGATSIIFGDPIVFLKNNSDRLISVEPLAANTTVAPESVEPDGEYFLQSSTSNAPITGMRIKYCVSTDVAACAADTAQFDRLAKTTTFYFEAPKVKKYYVKLTIDKSDKVSLEAQKGVLGRTSNMKWSLSDNIKTTEIKSTPARPQQAAPQRQAAPKMGVSSPVMPLMQQAAVMSKDVPLVGKTLQEIGEDLKKIKQQVAAKNVTRIALTFIDDLFDKVVKKNKDLKDEVAAAEYQFTDDEAVLAQEIAESFSDVKNKISKLREFLKMPSAGSVVTKSTIQHGSISAEITVEERQKVLQCIKILAPALYDLFTKDDPTGKDHIFRYQSLGAMVAPSRVDGLPMIFVDSNAINWPQGEMLFTLGHELSHYVLGHGLEEYHQDYPPEEVLKNARNRLRESECDRMSVLEFGTNIDDGIAQVRYWMEKQREYDLQKPHKKTLFNTHPLGEDRIKNLEALRREVELNKGRMVQRTPIDWKKLAQEYKKGVELQAVDASLVQKYVDKTYSQTELDKYTSNVTLKYKDRNAGELSYFVQADVDDRGKPWTVDNIKEFLDYNIYEVERDVANRMFTKETDNKFISDLLHAYYNAKLLELKFPNNEEIRIFIKAVLTTLLTKEIAGNSVVNIIQTFEKSVAL